MRFLWAALALPTAFASSSAAAQNVSSVASPDVKAGEKSFEYRAAFAPESDGAPSTFGHRLHYQQALSDAWRLRFIAVQNRRGDDPLRFRSVGLEAHWQFLEDENAGFDSALIFHGTIPDGNDGPGRARLASTSKYKSGPVVLQLHVLATREIGDAARDGVFLESREQALYRIDDKFGVGAQMFNSYNSTAHFGGFDEQRHQAGPVISGKLGKHLGYSASALIGLSERAPDEEFRLFLSYTL